VTKLDTGDFMTAPNVIISWCKRRATCRWCEQVIEPGTPMVKVFFWNKGDDGSRKWNISHYYHFPDCYAAQGMDYLNRNPYTGYKSSKGSKLSREDRRKRFLLVRKFNELHQRKKRLGLTYPDNVAMEIQLNNRMIEIMKEMVSLGGIPKSWTDKLG
jgi:hypothetical protein